MHWLILIDFFFSNLRQVELLWNINRQRESKRFVSPKPTKNLSLLKRLMIIWCLIKVIKIKYVSIKSFSNTSKYHWSDIFSGGPCERCVKLAIPKVHQKKSDTINEFAFKVHPLALVAWCSPRNKKLAKPRKKFTWVNIFVNWLSRNVYEIHFFFLILESNFIFNFKKFHCHSTSSSIKLLSINLFKINL